MYRRRRRRREHSNRIIIILWIIFRELYGARNKTDYDNVIFYSRPFDVYNTIIIHIPLYFTRKTTYVCNTESVYIRL